MRPGPAGARCVCALVAWLLLGCVPARDDLVVLKGATAVDVVSGREIADAVLLIRDGHVVALGTADEIAIPAGAEITDLRGRWIIPGLVDADTRLPDWALPLALAAGVTSLRTVASADTSRTGSVQPRRYQPAQRFDGRPEPGSVVLQSPAAADSAIALLRPAAAGSIDAGSSTKADILAALVNAARLRQLRVVAWAGRTDAVTAAQLGVAAIIGMQGIPAAAGDSALPASFDGGAAGGRAEAERSWPLLDSVLLAGAAEELAARRVILVPELARDDADASPADSLPPRPAGWNLPDSAWRRWLATERSRRVVAGDSSLRLRRASLGIEQGFVQTFVAAGGRIAAASGDPAPGLLPGESLHHELTLLAGAGLSPLECLRAATLWPAELLHADTLGRLRPGSAADLVVLRGDPLADITAISAVERVMLGGAWVKR